ncbi:carboxymuconolactone decarboxylase family protein [Sphingobium fuliginis]|uniref:Carboxymuconolactone decarboxylase family protein n=1 Tax=Sphingobium fuliginis ATCC 27551 TaxID=1208342 RepID=A0A5B8CCN0_SPHSA|nr:carboxymuconolactone decarboxylase family protein [Sphingobium fuliginis]QDC37264.1 carboxymuconolactone decarboxylase family protein [Sphingobium fuliginis ATCC 27551]
MSRAMKRVRLLPSVVIAICLYAALGAAAMGTPVLAGQIDAASGHSIHAPADSRVQPGAGAAPANSAHQQECAREQSVVDRRQALCEADLDSAQNQAVLGKLAIAKGGELNIHRVLGLSPTFFDGFVALATAIRRVDDLDQRDIELAILLTAFRRQGQYQMAQHRLLARRAGLSQTEIDSVHSWRASRRFDMRQRALLELVEQSLRPSGVTAAGYRRARRFFSDRQVMELVTISGFSAMSAQITNTFSVPTDVKE